MLVDWGILLNELKRKTQWQQFRTKARAVELLGKGQIADLPTAISRVVENGYDAYADKLSCNLYLPGYKDNQAPFHPLRQWIRNVKT